MQSVIKSWLSFEGKGILTEKLSQYLLCEIGKSPASNPFVSFLTLVRSLNIRNRKRRNDCVKDLTLSFENQLKAGITRTGSNDHQSGNSSTASEMNRSGNPSTVSEVNRSGSASLVPVVENWRARYLDDVVKLEFLLHMVEGEFFTYDLVTKWCELFELGSGDELRSTLVTRLRRLLVGEQDPNDLLVVAAAVAKIEAYDQFDLDVIFARLLLADKIQVLESFVSPSEPVQRQLLSLLDRWLNCSPMTIESECRDRDPDRRWASLPEDQLQWHKLEGKTVKKLVTRLAKKFAIDIQDDFHLVCPNFFRDKRFGTIRYNVIEFVRNAAIDQRTFMDNAEQLVLRDKDPQFPESALFALSQLDQELSSNYTFDEDLICRLSVKWCVPVDDLDQVSPLIREKIRNGNYATEETIDVKEEEHDLFFFALPLSEDRIVLVEDARGFDLACAKLQVSPMIGVDCEWPSFKGASGVVSLLQLAVADQVFLFDVKTLKGCLSKEQWSSLAPIFTSPSIEKIGYGIGEDLALLGASVPSLRPSTSKQSLRGVVDLKTVIDRIETLDPQLLRDYDIVDAGWDRFAGGLSGLVLALLGKGLEKSQQRSNWDARPLRRAQRKYAALDAYVLLLLHDDISRRIRELKGHKNLFDFPFYASGKLTPEEEKEKEKTQREKLINKRSNLTSKLDIKGSVGGGGGGGVVSSGDGGGGAGPARPETLPQNNSEDVLPKVVGAGVPAGFYDSDDSDDFFMGGGYDSDDSFTLGVGENRWQTKPAVSNVCSGDSSDAAKGLGTVASDQPPLAPASPVPASPPVTMSPPVDPSPAVPASSGSSVSPTAPASPVPGSSASPPVSASPAAPASLLSEEATPISSPTMNSFNVSSSVASSSSAPPRGMGRGRGRSRGRARSRVDEPEMVGASGAASMKLAGGPGRDAPGSVSLVGQRANDDWLKNNSKVDESGKLWFGRGCRPSGQSS